MYQWRKFKFFEEKSGGKAAIQCCSSGRGKIAIGCDDGTAGLIDRSFKLSSGFQAHSSVVLFLQQNLASCAANFQILGMGPQHGSPAVHSSPTTSMASFPTLFPYTASGNSPTSQSEFGH